MTHLGNSFPGNETTGEAIPEDIMQAARRAVVDGLGIDLPGSKKYVICVAEALLADRQRDQWQPIETAPKDGTTIILFCPQGDGTPGSTFRLTSGSWFVPPLHGTISDPEVDDQEPPAWLSWDGGFSEETMMPTHWQPLPAAPKGGEA